MSRCKEYRKPASKACSLKKLLSEVSADRLSKTEVVAWIVDITGYALASRFVTWCSAYNPYSKNYEVMEFYFITVMDEKDGLVCFNLHPRFLQRVWNGEISCGKMIRIKSCLVRMPPEGSQTTTVLKNDYIEILDMDVVKDEDNIPIPWRFNRQTTQNVMARIESFEKVVPMLVKLNMWQPMVPVWPSEVSSIAYPLPKMLAGWTSRWEEILGTFNITELNRMWCSYPCRLPLLVKVICKSKSIYYHSKTRAKPFPVRTLLFVCDDKAACTVVIWDRALPQRVLNQIHTGTILLIHSYNLKEADTRIVWPCDHRQTLCNVEIHIQDERQFNKQGLTVVSPGFSKNFDTLMPLPYLEFWRFCRIRDAHQNTLCNVAGTVIGLSRYFRLRRSEITNNACYLNLHWVEIRDVYSDSVLSIEVFLHTKLDRHQSLKVGDAVAFTFLRVCWITNLFPNKRILYLTTCQHSEMYVFPKKDGSFKYHAYTPDFVLREIAKMKKNMLPEVHWLPPTWVGGPHPFSLLSSLRRMPNGMVCLSAQNNTTISGPELENVLKRMAYKEVRCVLLLGTIVEVAFCTLNTFHSESLLNGTGKMVQQATMFYKAPGWYPSVRRVKKYGADLPFHASFPMNHTDDNSAYLHDSVKFIPTNILEMLERKYVVRNNQPTQPIEVMKKNYLRVTILTVDESAVVNCAFFPMFPDEHIVSLSDLLHLYYTPGLQSMQSPVSTNPSFSVAEQSNLKDTAHELATNGGVAAVIQIYCVGPNEFEYVLCSVKNCD